MTNRTDAKPIRWIKSSYSSGEGGQCVEWSPAFAEAHRLVPVRDSKDPYGPALAFEPRAWSSFVSALRHDGLRA